MAILHDTQNVFSVPLRRLVSVKFTHAKAKKDIVFSDTHLASLRSRYRIPIQLRYCPALGKKPVKKTQSEDKEKTQTKPFDPFESPPPELKVVEVPVTDATHNIVLNKYPVIPNHFILATKDNKPQTNLLEEDDLYLTYACLRAWKEADHSLFAFFNSGEHSGASQPHRHLQFLPVEDMAGDAGDDWYPLCDTMCVPVEGSSVLLHNPELPFVHFAVSVEDDPSPADLLKRYRLLLEAGLVRLRNRAGLGISDTTSIDEHGRTTFSYNLAMTAKLMAILPRKQESSQILDNAKGTVAINGTFLAGTMMVKNEEEWQQLQQRPALIEQIVQDITFCPAELVPSDREKL